MVHRRAEPGSRIAAGFRQAAASLAQVEAVIWLVVTILLCRARASVWVLDRGLGEPQATDPVEVRRGRRIPLSGIQTPVGWLADYDRC